MSEAIELSPNDPRATVCGHCGRGWDDSVSTSVTPTPAARCPFEYDHEYPDCETVETQAVTIASLLDGLRSALLDQAESFTDAESALIIEAARQNGRLEFAKKFSDLTIPNEI